MAYDDLPRPARTADRHGAGRLVVMGVSGSGKTTIGSAIAAARGVPFLDADDLHPPSNRAKMADGDPLSDEDRWPWLDAVGEWLADHPGGAVTACSALRLAYRDRLRARAGSLDVVMLSGSAELLRERLVARQGHFMPVSLLDSQLATLEPRMPDEPGLTVDLDTHHEIADVLAAVERWERL